MCVKCLRSYKVPKSTLILFSPSHLSCLGRPSSTPCCDPRFFSEGAGPWSQPRATGGMPSVTLSAWGGARVLIDSRAPSRQRESTCSEVFRAPVGWNVRLREAYGSMSFTIFPICSYLRSLHCASISNGKMGVLSGESPGWRRQKLSRFFLSAFLEPMGGGGSLFLPQKLNLLS